MFKRWKETKDSSIIERVQPDNVVHPHGIRRENAPYIVMWVLFYTWVIAFATWWTASPVTDSAFETQIRSLTHTCFLLSSAVFVFIIRRKWYVRALRIGAAMIVLSLILFYAVPSVSFKILAAVIGAVAIGCVNICILIPLVFATNNTERLYAIIISNALIQVVSLVNEHSGAMEAIMSFVLLGLSLITVLFFQTRAKQAGESDEPAANTDMSKRVYLSLLFNCAIAIICKGVGKGILNIAVTGYGLSTLTGYYIGGLAGCLVYVLVYAFTKKAYIWLGNLTFSSVTIGLLCNAFISQEPRLAVPFAVLLGLGSTVGMINMYYIIGVIGKKYNSMRYIRLSIVFISICGSASGILFGNMISWAGTYEISISASILSAVVMLAFMFVSPIMERADYVNDWGSDSNHTEVGGGRLALYKPYALSKREAEVCDLLLQGYTLRQISAILPIAYSTVNTYCTSAYRKLGINSRTELLLKFKEHITE